MERKMRAIAKQEVGKHEKSMHKDKSFKKGGPTGEDRMKYGKQMSRIMNQKTG